MEVEPDIAYVASLIGEHARARMLTALMGGRALTATELAEVADVTRQTASSHLAKLECAKLVSGVRRGRYRYYRLSRQDVASTLELLMNVADHIGPTRQVETGPAEPRLREARTCYDHLAGQIAVQILRILEHRRLLVVDHSIADRPSVCVSDSGIKFFEDLGIDVRNLAKNRRPLCLVCLDWSARDFHLSGALGAQLLTMIFARKWAKRDRYSRAVTFTEFGRRQLQEILGVSTTE